MTREVFKLARLRERLHNWVFAGAIAMVVTVCIAVCIGPDPLTLTGWPAVIEGAAILASYVLFVVEVLGWCASLALTAYIALLKRRQAKREEG
jgi:hypothetical protein